jgi:hypothetical protein
MSDDLGYIREALGRIEQKIDGSVTLLAQHTGDDKVIAKALFDRIEVLQLGAAKQKGALRVWGIVGSTVGAGIGYLIERVTLGRHS